LVELLAGVAVEPVVTDNDRVVLVPRPATEAADPVPRSSRTWEAPR